MWIKRLPAVLLIAISAALASTPCRGLELFTIEQENKLGEETYREILKKEKINKDPNINAFVKRVVDRITSAAPDMEFKYEFSVLDSENINAFVLPGGKICVYTGILPFCYNEAGLATVMGHEVAHAILRHGGQRMTQQTVVGVGGKLAEAVLGAAKVGETGTKVALGAYGYGSQLGILLPYSRSHETEADEHGLMYMAKSGYDPREAPAFWKRFSTLKSGAPTFLSTHPASDERARRLTELQPKALRFYDQAAKNGRGELIPAEYRKELPGVDMKELEKEPSQAGVSGSIHNSDAEIIAALRALLRLSAQAAIRDLKDEESFNKNESVKLKFPEELKDVEAAAKAAGADDRVKEFVKCMNQAASTMAGESGELLAEAIAGLQILKPVSVLDGKKTAATELFGAASQAQLRSKFSTALVEINVKVGVRKTFLKMASRSGAKGKEAVKTFDLNAYVARCALDGLIHKMAEHEIRIRNNPAALKDEKSRLILESAK